MRILIELLCLQWRRRARVATGSEVAAFRNTHKCSKVRSHEARQLPDFLSHWVAPYSRSFADGRFPVDVDAVGRDHEFLDADSLHALYRRLYVLNRIALHQRATMVAFKSQLNALMHTRPAA